MPQSSFSYRILIVDDEPTIREVGKMLLESRGYEIITAGDGFEGLLALQGSLPDIIISDLSMPNMSGFEFLSVVRRRFPTIPVIVISGEFSDLTALKAFLQTLILPKVSTRRTHSSPKSQRFSRNYHPAPAWEGRTRLQFG